MKIIRFTWWTYQLREDSRIDWTGEKVKLHQINIAAFSFKPRSWAIRWRHCKLQCQQPKVKVEQDSYAYDSETLGDLELQKLKRSYEAQKAQLTKINNALAEAEEANKSELWPINEMPGYQKAMNKKAEKEKKLGEARKRYYERLNAVKS
jgi:hypothetical protein